MDTSITKQHQVKAGFTGYEHPHGDKLFFNEVVGELTLHYESLVLPDDGQTLVLYSAGRLPHGGETAAAVQLDQPGGAGQALRPERNGPARTILGMSRRTALFLAAFGVWSWVIWIRLAKSRWDSDRAWAADGSPTAYFIVHAVLTVVSFALGTIIGVIGWRAWRKASVS